MADHGGGGGRWEIACPRLIPQPYQPCPKAVKEYPKRGGSRYKEKVRSHLAYLGWTIYYDSERTCFRYTSPDGKTSYLSLRDLCLDLIPGKGRLLARQETLNLSTSGSNDADRPKGHCPEAVVEYLNEHGSENVFKKSNSDLKSKVRRHLCAIGWTIDTSSSGVKKLVYTSPNGKKSYSLVKACEVCIAEEGVSQNQTPVPKPKSKACVEEEEVVSQNQTPVPKPKRKRKRSCSSDSDDDESESEESESEKSASSAGKVKIHVPKPCISISKPHTLLSWLIKNGVVDDGIGLSHYSFSRAEIFNPFGNLFLEDGRSVLECQRQVLLAIKARNLNCGYNSSLDDNDNICSICGYGGTLMLCDRCPSAFHHTCIGLRSIPEGEWICRSCKCNICNRYEYDSKASEYHDLVLNCKLCARKFHVGCIDKEKRVSRMEDKSSYTWFCNERCEKVFTTLDELSGRTYFGPENLTWTVLKPMEEAHLEQNDPMMPAYVVNQSKLHIAVGLLQECFMPILEKFTGQDMIESVVFNMKSDLKRLNFQGFYTITVERNENLLAVATIRVHDKVAELPFIATSAMCQRQGVGRIMMNKVEELLQRLGGIQRLILPAAPALVEMWTRKFGFVVMTETERLRCARYNLLAFQKTILCYKVLGRRAHSVRYCN